MKRILIVEDEENIRKVVKTALEIEGYEVITSENGELGLEKARSVSPDIILLDIMLPDITGIEV